jgi:hypothetical protein
MAAKRDWVVYTNWAELTEAERAATFDHAIPAILLAWCRAGELEASDGVDGAGTGDRGGVDGSGQARIGGAVA